MKRHGLLAPIIVCICIQSAFAQSSANSAELTGKVWDEQQTVQDLVTVRLFAAEGESALQTAYTDDNGTYRFQRVQPGTYHVVATKLGLMEARSGFIQVSPSSGPVIEVPTLTMKLESVVLADVTVRAERPLIERKMDMMVVNVENSTLAAGNTALEILQKSPGVTVDKDDNISLMGKQGVTLMINGKKTNLTADQLASYLSSLDGNTVKSVELITNPSSKYEASGTAGIINIVLKRNTRRGTNGQVTLSGGYGLAHKSNASVTLNHGTGAVNVYGMVSYLDNDNQSVLDIGRLITSGVENTAFGQRTVLDRSTKNRSVRAGVDYNLSSRQILNLEVNGNRNGFSMLNTNVTNIGPDFLTRDSTLRTLSDINGRFNSAGANLHYTFNVDSNGRKFVAQADVSQFYRTARSAYDNTFYWPDGSLMRPSSLSLANTPTTINIRVASADYTHPLINEGKIEAGLRYSQVESTNTMRFENYTDEQWQNDPLRSNTFVYDEYIYAAYVSYQRQFGKLGLQAGLRTEYTESVGESITLNSRVKRDYIDFFPTLFLNYAISDNHQAGLSFSRRVNRPNYNLMNPFNYYIDQYTSEQGNPYLRPEYANAVEATYSFKNKYHLSAGYSLTTDVIVESMLQDEVEKTTAVTRANLAEQRSAHLNITAPFKIRNYWNTNVMLNGFYLGFKGELNANRLDRGQFATQATNQHTFTITPKWTAELNLQYNSPLTYSIYSIKGQFGSDIGVSRSLFGKQGNIKLAVSDIFNTRKQLVRTNHGNLNVNIDQRHETRIARLTLTYNLGKNGFSQRNRNIEEKNRVGQ